MARIEVVGPTGMDAGAARGHGTSANPGADAGPGDGPARAAREVLAGRRRGLAALTPFLGPAFVASIAYMDPGNFATNIQGGAQFGYGLLWAVVFANLAAMLFQSLSAKLGIVTGRNLAEMCRDHFPRPLVLAMWVASEVAAMATDLAEFLGATLALNLLLGMPMLVGACVTGVATYAILLLERRGARPIEAVIALAIGIMAVCYVIELVLAQPDWGGVLRGATVPRLQGSDSVMLVVGIVGATVMPHAIFLHSGLTQARVVPRGPEEAARIIRFSNIEVGVALTLAGLVNLAMMVMAASVFHPGHAEVASIETAYHTLTPLLGSAAAGVFLASLLASGLSSSVVGTMAGQIVMQGFIGLRIPIWLRRVATMLPSIVVIGLGIEATRVLVVSQVVLSLVLPVPIIALLIFTGRRDIMGPLVNRRITGILAWTAGLVILVLNLLLLADTAGLPVL